MLFARFARLNRRMRNVVLSCLVVIAAIAMYGWMVAPHTNYLFAARRYECAATNILEKHAVMKNNVERKRQLLKELQEKDKQLRGMLFTKGQADEFFSDLQAISVETGCAVYSLNLLPVEADKRREKQQKQLKPESRDEAAGRYSGIFTKRAVLSVVGIYRDLIRLMERLQKRSQKVLIDPVDMRILDDDSDQISCDITITVYVTEGEEMVIHE